MVTKVMKIGIISRDDYAKRTIAIAKGEYKPRKDEPKIWFESLKSMSQVLSRENQDLLKMIIEHKPGSLSVELPREEGKLVPRVKATDFKVEFGLHYSRPLLNDLESASA